MSSPPGYAAALEYLYALKPSGKNFGIDRMRPLAAALGNPEQRVPFIHVSGTNGKGSVSAMLESILRAAGWRTGLYTSPHLVSLGERVQVNRQVLTEQEIVDYVQELRPTVERVARAHPDNGPSFFELMTAMAFLQFERKGCDIGILEVGLGGALDATNIVDPQVSVITSIAKDHTEILGNELEKIAAAKAGIIKPRRTVVIGQVPEEAECVIREIAAVQESPVISVAEAYGNDIASYPKTNLEGEYQQWNAATATLALRALPEKWRITESAIAAGLQNVAWPGRWQRVQIGGRLAILDASHNPEGAQALEGNLARLRAETGRRPVVIVGVLGRDRAQPLIDVICRHAREIYFVVPDQPRACSHAELAALVPVEFKGRVVRAAVAELFPSANSCTAGTADDSVVVTGSMYLLGEVMARLGAPATIDPRSIKENL